MFDYEGNFVLTTSGQPILPPNERPDSLQDQTISFESFEKKFNFTEKTPALLSSDTRDTYAIRLLTE